MVQTYEQYKQPGERLSMLQVYWSIKLSMVARSISMVDQMKEHLVQLEEKIVQPYQDCLQIDDTFNISTSTINSYYEAVSYI